jgi:hypothetical protein
MTRQSSPQDAAKSASCKAFYGLLLAGAAFAAFEDLLSTDRIPAYRDLLLFVLPFKHFLATRLQQGNLPLWNPWIYLGTPFLASLQNGALYPPSVLLLLPFPLGFNLFVLLHFVMALAGFWLLSRGRGLSVAAASVGCLTFTLGGYLVSMVNLTSHLQTAVWAPWALFYWQRSTERGRTSDFAAFTLVVTGSLLAGAPEVLLMMVGLLAAWTACAAPGSRVARLRLHGTLAVLVVMAIGLAALQVLPTLEYIAHSNRRGALSLEEVAAWSLQPISLIQWLLPHSALPRPAPRLESTSPWIESIYLGLAPLCLVASGLARGREGRFWAAVTVVALLLALGASTPVLPLAYSLFPAIVGKFRYPEKFYFLVHFAAALLAAEGAEALFRGDERSHRLSCLVASALLVLVCAPWLYHWIRPDEYTALVARIGDPLAPPARYRPLAVDFAWKSERGALMLACFLGILGLRRVRLLGASTACATIVALVAADLAPLAHGLNRTISWRALQGQRPIVDVEELTSARQRVFLYQTTSARFAGDSPEPVRGLEKWLQVRQDAGSFEGAARSVWATMPLDVPVVHELGTLSGDDGIMRSSDVALRAALSTAPRDGAVKLLGIFGVSRLAGPVPLEVPGLDPLPQVGQPPIYVYRVVNFLPDAYLATRLHSGANRASDAFRMMMEPDFTPGVDAVVSELPADWQPTLGNEAAGEVRTTDRRDDRIELTVHADRLSLLVLNDSFYPGWEARIDGHPTRIHRVNFLVRGVVVGAGDHTVEFRYRPSPLRLGISISLATLLTGMFAAAVRRRGASGAAIRR